MFPIGPSGNIRLFDVCCLFQNVANVFDQSLTLLNNQTIIYVVPDDVKTKTFMDEVKKHEAFSVVQSFYLHTPCCRTIQR